MTLYCDKDKRYLDMPCTVYFHSVFAHSDLFTLFELERLLLLDSDRSDSTNHNIDKDTGLS